MPKETVSLVMNGEVYIEDLANALKGWVRLMSAISHEESPRSEIHWVVDSLSTGSFFGTLRAERNGTGIEAIERSVVKYEQIGKSIRAGRIREYSQEIRSAAKEMVAVVGSRIKSVRFETEETETEVYSPVIEEAPPDQASIEKQPPPKAEPVAKKIESFTSVPSFGSIRGRLQTVSDRHGLKFMLYEINTDRSVTCYIDPEGSVDKETLRNDWGKLAAVTGMIRRDPVTGDATTIRRVRNIQVIEPLPKGAWRKLKGIAPALNDITPEAAIRAVRDG
jgi:hypothetical protein